MIGYACAHSPLFVPWRLEVSSEGSEGINAALEQIENRTEGVDTAAEASCEKITLTTLLPEESSGRGREREREKERKYMRWIRLDGRRGSAGPLDSRSVAC